MRQGITLRKLYAVVCDVQVSATSENMQSAIEKAAGGAKATGQGNAHSQSRAVEPGHIHPSMQAIGRLLITVSSASLLADLCREGGPSGENTA